MAGDITIFAICGSLRGGSYNRLALEAACDLAPAGVRFDVYDRLAELPPFNQDDEKNPPEAVRDLKARIRAADAVLFVTPEYNYSVPGVLKNAIDWASRRYGDSAWAGKPAAIMSASTSIFGGARAQYHLRQSAVFLDMPVVNQPEVMIPKANEKFDAHGHLTDDLSKQLIAQLLAKLVELASLHGAKWQLAAAG